MPPPLAPNDLQGLVLSGYARLPSAAYHLLRLADPAVARGWLRGLAGRLTYGVPEAARTADWRTAQKTARNLAVTAAGLRELGQSEVMYERAFLEGMAADERPRVLGDNGPGDPGRWLWGGPSRPPVHLLLALYAADDAGLKQLEGTEQREYEAAGLTAVHVVRSLAADLQNSPGQSREHFGFADGLSQPALRELAPTDPDAVAAGEFVLGQVNEYGRVTEHPPAAVGGSYLVVRQLHQDVAGFWRFWHLQGGSPAEAERLAAKAVGRWPSGAVVRAGQVAEPEEATGGWFDYTDDREGLGVPVGAHVRRTNPRGTGLGPDRETSLLVARRHRLLRRARAYGPRLPRAAADDGAERGLLFLAVMANIERQFEFVQQTWMNNPLFGTLYGETDPLAGDPTRVTGSPASGTPFTIPGCPVRRRVAGVPRFVTTRGGEYFLLLGRRQLETLADRP